MKILIADKLSDKAIESLNALGAKVDFQPDLKTEEIPDVIKNNEILIVRSTKVDSNIIDAGKQLGLIIRAGAGVNTIDLESASKRGIYVANCPGKNSDAVAELALGLLIAADRGIVDASTALRNGKWQKKKFGKGAGLKGRTLGVIGLGMIGKSLVKRALGLEMNVIAWSRSLTPETAKELGIGYADSPLTVAKEADAISLHVAVNPETRHLVNSKFLMSMKPGAILVNAARGEVVDTAAMQEAITQKEIKYATDVFENEPAGGEADFEQTGFADLITCTPHIGASTEQAADAIAYEAVRIVKTYKETGTPANAVNLCAKSPATCNLVVRHFNRVGVLAGVLTALREEGVNVEEMHNTIFDGAAAACCTLLLDSIPSDKCIAKINSNENVIDTNVQEV